MPIYEYECGSCHERHEIMQKFSDPLQTTCPACGDEALHKLISPAGFQLKGSGWYVTDFKDKKKPTSEAGKTEEKKADPASSTTEKKTEKSTEEK